MGLGRPLVVVLLVEGVQMMELLQQELGKAWFVELGQVWLVGPGQI